MVKSWSTLRDHLGYQLCFVDGLASILLVVSKICGQINDAKRSFTENLTMKRTHGLCQFRTQIKPGSRSEQWCLQQRVSKCTQIQLYSLRDPKAKIIFIHTCPNLYWSWTLNSRLEGDRIHPAIAAYTVLLTQDGLLVEKCPLTASRNLQRASVSRCRHCATCTDEAVNKSERMSM